ncbi:gag-pol polyprotein [Cucumis melo var. makuwa]|uniref:Gag-pol polyprotein n=1 Tax=Cucumis melo var. makuwa TaxID=1194695 RepID=A0A5A7SR90_CUCMM|nr:gag-pol polyprotein [Cucumis melo var. makuwa]TYK03482.1 gag-pol polyprotein [Cucumis melo var. makuwa]
MDDHMTEDAPKDAKKKKDWLRDDARLYLQIKNSIESEIIGLVKSKYIECLRFFRAEQKAESVTNYFMRLKKITAALALLLPFSPDVKVQQAQREKMVVTIFLNGLLPEFGMTKAQILSDSKIPSLDDAFTRVLRIESSPNGVSIPQSSSALISKNNNPRAPRAMDGNVQRKSYDHRKPYSTKIVCNYCHKPGHIKRDCRKLLYKNSQQSQHAQIASTCDIPEASVTISADEYTKFQNYQDPLQASSSSTPIASTVAPGNTKCLLTSSTKWVIDSSATTHMTGNSRLFSRPLSPAPFPSVTLDRVMKKIIGRGYESGGLYLFDHQVSQAVACHVVPSPFEVHCRLGHPSLFVLKKLYPEFRMPSSLLNGDIPYRVLFPTKSLFPIAPKIFGCVCFVRDVSPHHTKLDPKSLKCIFLGYSRVQKGYRCYRPTLKRYLVSCDVAFFDDTPFTSSPLSSC